MVMPLGNPLKNSCETWISSRLGQVAGLSQPDAGKAVNATGDILAGYQAEHHACAGLIAP
jgi:hypothetical protein